jgi:hypothetical protein
MHNTPPRLQVLDHELEEHALKDVLHEAMQNMLATEPELRADEEAGRAGCLGRKGNSRSANLSPAELESATKWLLERFGHDGADDKDDSDGEDDEARSCALACVSVVSCKHARILHVSKMFWWMLHCPLVPMPI